MRAEDGTTVSVVDIHKPFGIELTYDVLEDDHTLVPVMEFYNEEGMELFSTHDTSVDWRRRSRPPRNLHQHRPDPRQPARRRKFGGPCLNHVPLSRDHSACSRTQRHSLPGG